MRAFLLVLVLATPGSAELIPIAELSFEGFDFGGFGTPPTELLARFSVGAPPEGQWMRKISVADVGQTFDVERDQVALMAHSIEVDPFDDIWFGFGLVHPVTQQGLQYGFQESTLLTGGYSNAVLSMLAPSIRTYPLAAVTVTVDDVRILQQQGFWQYGGKLTARMYAVPEPASGMLLLFGMSCLICHHRGTPHHAVFAS